MSNPNTKKSCVVPKCTNTTRKTPDKLFFLVPMDGRMRKQWLNAMRRLDPFGAKSRVYCCEDHFDIETDMENYVKYKLVGGVIKLKKGTVPHKFICQQEKEDKPERSAVQKRNRIKYFRKLFRNKDEEPITSTLNATERKPEGVFITPCEDETEIIEDPLSFGNDQYVKKTKKCSKGVQVKLNAKGIHKSTMTEDKYLKKSKLKKS